MNRDKIIKILKSRGIAVAMVFTFTTLGGAYIGGTVVQHQNKIIIEEKNNELDKKNSSIEQLREDINDLKETVTGVMKSNDELKSELEIQKAETENLINENNKLKDMMDLKKTNESGIISRGAQTSSEYTNINAEKVLIEVSAYCPTDEGVGDTTANGQSVQVGHIAAPPGIPFGTDVIIEGFDQTFAVTDRGGYIQTTYNEQGEPVYRVDIFVNSYEEAMQIGRKTVYGYFIYN